MDSRLPIRERVERAVAQAVSRHALWPPGTALVAAVSGGADSLCLLGVLLALQERRHPLAPKSIVVAHVDHGLRGAEGERDAAWVANFATSRGLTCVVERADVVGLAREQHRSLEDAARRVRYAFLRRVAHETAAERICTGHTLDDQAETLVLHWLRGSGLSGLAGMQPLAGDIARPLLDLTHADALAYCAARGWQPCEDPTNADRRFLRNRVRHELLPLLETYNPQLRETLARNARLLAEDDRYLETQTEAAWDGAVQEDSGIRIAIGLATLRAMPPALRHRLLRRAASRLGGEASGLEASHVEALDRLIASGRTGARLNAPGGLRFRLTYGALVCELPGVAHSEFEPEARTEAVRLTVPGAVELPEIGWRVRAWLSDGPPGLGDGVGDAANPEQPRLPAAEWAGTLADTHRSETRAYLDAEAAGGNLWVRTWRPGDRFRPLGMAHEKKLQDYFADAKVPAEMRRRVPLVTNGERIVWVAGHRVDDRAKLTPATRTILVLQLEPLGHAQADF
ncbi:MAG TPA: tRNA lysidine(34) synthetase TilS [Ktedonobacterales bacterium]|nr:tRNA lysidine(34) synthetase TilS [Ktedonobacterales bacterium]